MYQKLFGTKIEDKPKEEKEQQDNLDAVDIVKDNVSMFENIGTYQNLHTNLLELYLKHT